METKRREKGRTTNPYCPPVGAMSSDETPLVVEITDELPAAFEV